MDSSDLVSIGFRCRVNDWKTSEAILEMYVMPRTAFGRNRSDLGELQASVALSLSYVTRRNYFAFGNLCQGFVINISFGIYL